VPCCPLIPQPRHALYAGKPIFRQLSLRLPPSFFALSWYHKPQSLTVSYATCEYTSADASMFLPLLIPQPCLKATQTLPSQQRHESVSTQLLTRDICKYLFLALSSTYAQQVRDCENIATVNDSTPLLSFEEWSSPECNALSEVSPACAISLASCCFSRPAGMQPRSTVAMQQGNTR
jgi:hypothetical protein